MIGTSGSGKTTLARRLAEQLDLPHLELDAVFHQPGWTPLPTDEFLARVEAFCAQDRWVVCGKYAAVRGLIFDRADTIVCLDHNRFAQTARVFRRTVRRARTGQELWNGNRESWTNLWPFQDPTRSIVRWTWENVPRARTLFDEVTAHPPHPGIEIVRLRGFGEIAEFLAAASPGPPT